MTATVYAAGSGAALPARVRLDVAPEIFDDMVASARDALLREPDEEFTPADLRLRYGFTRAEIEAAGTRAIRHARVLNTGARICRRCGCWQENACVDARGPCRWVEPDLCSHCAEPLAGASPERRDGGGDTGPASAGSRGGAREPAEPASTGRGDR